MKTSFKKTALDTITYLSLLFVVGLLVAEVRSEASSPTTINLDKHAATARDKSEREYEKWYWAEQKKDPETFPRVIGRVVTSNGKTVTGRLLFISECPKDIECAQPDESFTDSTINPDELSDKNTGE